MSKFGALPSPAPACVGPEPGRPTGCDRHRERARGIGRRAPQAGFTVLEMMLVLSVAGVLLATAVPSMTQMVIRNRLQTQASSLMTDMMYARAEAARVGVNVTLCPSSNGTSCSGTDWKLGRIVFIDAGAPNTVDGTDRVLRVTQDIDAATTFAPTAALTALNFRPDGVPSGTPIFRTCRSGYNAMQVQLFNTGRARMTRLTTVC